MAAVDGASGPLGVPGPNCGLCRSGGIGLHRMGSDTRPPLADGTYYAADSEWRTSGQASSLIVWLNQLDIDEHTVYRIDIGPIHATIYRFKHKNGKPYLVMRYLAKRIPLTVTYS